MVKAWANLFNVYKNISFKLCRLNNLYITISYCAIVDKSGNSSWDWIMHQIFTWIPHSYLPWCHVLRLVDKDWTRRLQISISKFSVALWSTFLFILWKNVGLKIFIKISLIKMYCIILWFKLRIQEFCKRWCQYNYITVEKCTKAFIWDIMK